MFVHRSRDLLVSLGQCVPASSDTVWRYSSDDALFSVLFCSFFFVFVFVFLFFWGGGGTWFKRSVVPAVPSTVRHLVMTSVKFSKVYISCNSGISSCAGVWSVRWACSIWRPAK